MGRKKFFSGYKDDILKREALPKDWDDRLKTLFPLFFSRPFSEPHKLFWEWANSIDIESSPKPMTAFWPRGRGKSTHAEALVADLGLRDCRRYCMYVSGTQDQADKHVATIRNMLESEHVRSFFPNTSKPRLTRTGSQTWRRNMLVMSNGYAVESVGLNKAVRGQKVDWARPDLIVLDDVDERTDSPLTIDKKTRILKSSIIPAGSPNVAVLFVQNLVHKHSIASTLANSSDHSFLANRTITDVCPAVDGLEYEFSKEKNRWVITKGVSLWNGFSIDHCENEINLIGPDAYDMEFQHEVENDNPNAQWTSEIIESTRVSDYPELEVIYVAVDPPGGATECGIVVGGKARVRGIWHSYTIADHSVRAGCTANEWGLATLRAYHQHQANAIVVEVNFGGDMVKNTIRQLKLKDSNGNVLVDGSRVPIIEVRATRGKAIRAEPVAVMMYEYKDHHVGYFPLLEKEMTGWEIGKKSPNRLDAKVWLNTQLGVVKAISASVSQWNGKI